MSQYKSLRELYHKGKRYKKGETYDMSPELAGKLSKFFIALSEAEEPKKASKAKKEAQKPAEPVDTGSQKAEEPTATIK